MFSETNLHLLSTIGLLLGALLLDLGHWVPAIAVLVGSAAPESTLQWRRRRRRRLRSLEVEAASVVAAEDDSAFAADAVREAAAELYLAVSEAQCRHDRERLAYLLAPEELARELRRIVDLEWLGRYQFIEVHGRPRVEYVGLVNRSGTGEDRVVVRITADQRDAIGDVRGQIVPGYEGDTGEWFTVVRTWTLERYRGRWRLASVQLGSADDEALEDPIVALPEDDERSSPPPVARSLSRRRAP